VKNIIELLLKTAEDERSPHDELVHTYSDSGDDSNSEDNYPVRFPSSSSPTGSLATLLSDPSSSNPLDHPPTPSSSSRPRKRRRRHTSDSRHPSGSGGALLAEFDKTLTTELICEICFMLFYQPVTTPCQHVRISSFCFGMNTLNTAVIPDILL